MIKNKVSKNELKKMRVVNSGQATFEWALSVLFKGYPSPLYEYRFDSDRKWRFDNAWTEFKIAVEIDGGQWEYNGGRHNRDSDRDKINAAVSQGWAVLRFSTQQIANETEKCIDILKQTFAIRGLKIK